MDSLRLSLANVICPAYPICRNIVSRVKKLEDWTWKVLVSQDCWWTMTTKMVRCVSSLENLLSHAQQ